MRLVITGGGTGGHLYPGIAVAEAMRARLPEAEIRFVGGTRIEARIIPEAGWPFEQIAAHPLPRRAGVAQLKAFAVNLLGLIQAAGLLSRHRPNAVLATGGYVAGPVGLAAVLLGIPLVVQEQNAIPGLTNRWLGRWARRISLPSAGVGVFPQERIVVTGVPVRPAALRGERRAARAALGLAPDRFTILTLGGSQGALTLNRAVTEAGTLLMYEPVQILHQTGAEHLEWVRGAIGHREHVGPPVLRQVAVAFIERMGDAYAAADMVICRAGASTLAEVTAWGLPAILVPYPHAAGDHQEANARRLADAGAAEVIADADLTGIRLAQALGTLLRQPARRREMGEAARALAHPEAADRVVDLLLEAAGRSSPRQAPPETGAKATASL